MSDSKDPVSGGCPMHAGQGENPNVYGQSDITYNEYLKIPEMLELQKPLSDPEHHDELLFIVIHQAYELWFKLVLHEIELVIKKMDEDQILKARHHLNRTVEIMRLLVHQIHILETMTPVDFLAFRDHLKPASGFQSLQFRELEFAMGLKDERYYVFFKNKPAYLSALQKRAGARDLRAAFFDLARRQGLAIPSNAWELEKEPSSEARKATIQAFLPLYREPHKNDSLYLLAETLMDLDDQLGHWREHHVKVVERIIGFKRGTGGSSGVGYLQATTSKRSFPSLWDVRTELV